MGVTRLLDEDESLVLVLRQHVIVLFWPLVALLVTVPAAAVLVSLVPAGSFQPWARLAVILVATLVVLAWVVWPFLRWWTQTYVVTSRRLLLREGVFNRSGHDMPLVRLNDVSFSHSFWQRLLGCGTIEVESAGERGQIRLQNVPRVETVQHTLHRLAEDSRSTAPRIRPAFAFDPDGDQAEGVDPDR
jgi:uncharacterized membrane protein YdbT with pleckstrin-like domain